MRIFYSEFQNVYSTYTFAYGVYCYKDKQSELPEIYGRGFLPYSGNYSIQEDIFYLARSVRIDLKRFADTSENRRVDRKITALNLAVDCVARDDFDINGEQFRAFCESYAEERFKGGVMDRERLAYVLGRGVLTHIFIFKSDGLPVGYVFAAIEQNMLHYWFSFYDTQYLAAYSLGKWMMWRTIRWAKENGLDFAYLGTAYKRSALYKIRDHKGAEFFDGSMWNDNIELLSALCAKDEETSPRECDLFKSVAGLDVPTRSPKSKI